MFTRRHGPALRGKSHRIVGTPNDLVPRAFLTHTCAQGASAICRYESGFPTQRWCWGHFQLRGLCSRLCASPFLFLCLPRLGGSRLPCVSPFPTDSKRVVHFCFCSASYLSGQSGDCPAPSRWNQKPAVLYQGSFMADFPLLTKSIATTHLSWPED